jgi:tripartite-type tricarboxylate transporter receptor subunit TctC
MLTSSKQAKPAFNSLILGKLILALSFYFGISLAQAQNYPNRTVKMVVPLTTGSGAGFWTA